MATAYSQEEIARRVAELRRIQEGRDKQPEAAESEESM